MRYIFLIFLFIIGHINAQELNSEIYIDTTPITLIVNVNASCQQQLILDVESINGYFFLLIKSNNITIVDHLNISHNGRSTYKMIVKFQSLGKQEIQIINKGNPITIKKLKLQPHQNIEIPEFEDVSDRIGLKTEETWKYGGPSVGDVNNDGFYDFVLNNHDKVPAKLFWNLGDGTIKEHHKTLYQWDIHGTAIGDYDNDGDLDILVTQGGGNGTNPQPPHLLKNENGNFIRVSDSVGITLGARGRAARWVDMDNDNDLDLLLINAKGINSTEGIRHIFYENNNGSFSLKRIKGLEQAEAERLLVMDINNDKNEDLILFEPLSIWKGNGDFTFSDVTSHYIAQELLPIENITGASAIDFNNDGWRDLYLSRGKTYYQMANKSYDFDPMNSRLDIRDEGNKGITTLTIEAENEIILSDIFLWYRMYDDGFPLYLGKDKVKKSLLTESDILIINEKDAQGWSTERKQNGWYLGYLGNNKWKLEWVRNHAIYWGIRISIQGVKSVTTDWEPQNRNVDDIFLKNNKGKSFKDLSEEVGLLKGGNNQGVTVGDFNNDGFEDLYIYRFGFLKSRITDILLLNEGNGKFNQLLGHSVIAQNDKGHGDMGQAFDYDNDGRVDLLNGSDNYGKWYLFKNESTTNNNFIEINVGYSLKENIDPLFAEVYVKTNHRKYRKIVGSAGEVHSQSVLNIVHFGLGKEKAKFVKVVWRNGEEMILKSPKNNTILTTEILE